MSKTAIELMDDLATAFGYEFNYGTKAMTNLLRSDMIEDKIYFLLASPTDFKVESSKYGTGRDYIQSSFILCVKSKLDNVTYKQKNQDAANGKFMKNVSPLLNSLKAFEKSLVCSNEEYERINAIDAYNLLDANTDGLIVDFKYTVNDY